MVINTCPHCGSLLIEKVIFPPVKQRIFDYIRKHPHCTADAIVAAVYRDDPDGGPDSNALSVHLNQMKPILKENGLRIVCPFRGPGATYHIEKEETYGTV